ncbi:hypothetical protein [Candidatus Hodgkinia cicadicola]
MHVPNERCYPFMVRPILILINPIEFYTRKNKPTHIHHVNVVITHQSKI